MSYESLKSAVTAVITANGSNEITGQILQDLINNNLIPSLGENLFMGVATSTTVPQVTPEKGIYYAAFKQGTYVNFSGVVVKNQFCFLKYDTVNSVWEKIVLLTLKPELYRSSLEHSLFLTDENIANGNVFGGRVQKIDGSTVLDANWLSTDYVYVHHNPTITRVATAFSPTGSSVAGISFFDEDLTYLGYVETIPETFTYKAKDYYPEAYYMRVSGAASLGISLKLKHGIVKDIEDLKIQSSLLITRTDYAENPLIGFLDSTGTFISSANWRSTDFIDTSVVKTVSYRGTANGNARAIVGYDENQNYLQDVATLINSQVDLVEYTIPENVKYVRASARMVSGDVFEFVVIDRLGESFERDFFIPKTLYAKQSERFRINPNGLMAKHPDDHSPDIFSDLQQSNEKYIQFVPATADKTVNIFYRDLGGNLKNAGSTLVKVTPTANIVNPSVHQNFICLGDSLTEGVSASGIQGAYTNELARRLTGVGTELLSGNESPAPLALSNVHFRGTRGDQAILHEGRGGWAASTYLGVASSGGVTNAFWNPSTSEFDLDYYLDQNNFKSSQIVGGVTPTGDNLTVIILLGWNNAYNSGAAGGAAGISLLIDKIKADMPDVKVKMLGLNTPPTLNYKTFTGSRNVTAESIMRDVILPFNRAYEELAESTAYNSFVEFVPISPVFFPERSYPTTNLSASFRDDTAIEVNTDYVHPVARGYAQIADALFYNILYNYCRS